MPLSTLIVVLAIIGVFAIFGITLAWTDYRTSRRPLSRKACPTVTIVERHGRRRLVVHTTTAPSALV